MDIKQLLHKDVIKNTSTVLSGNVIAQLISFAVYPLLTRIYSPDDFGVLTVFLSIGGIWIIIAGGEYYNSVMLPRERKKAVACFQVSLLTILAVSLLCVLSIIFKDFFAQCYKSETLGDWYFLLPLYVLFSALWVVLQHWYSREKRFKAVSGYQIGLSSTNAAMKSGFGLGGLTTGGMIWSMTIAPFISLSASVLIHLRKELKELLHFDWKAIKSAASEYSNFPKYATPRMLLHNIIWVMPALVLTPYFSVEEIGFFGMAITLSLKPMTVCISSMYSVFFQKFAAMVSQKERITPTLRRYMKTILLVSIPSFAILYFILPWFTEVLLGEGWRFTGELIQVMLPCYVSMLITSTFNFIPDIFNKQKMTLLFEVINLIVSVAAIVIGIYLNDFHTVIMLLFQSYTLVWVAEGVWIYHIAGAYDKELQE